MNKRNIPYFQKNYITKSETTVIKGVALVFMFIHHFFTFPRWYIDSISYPYLEEFAFIFSDPFRICVSVFAFLTGYSYYHVKVKSIKYSLKKSSDVWLVYFVFFLLLLIPAVVLGCWNGSARNFLLEALGLFRPTMIFCWYVDFYILVMMVLPLFHKVANRHTLLVVVFGIILPVLLYYVSYGLLTSFRGSGINNCIIELFQNFLIWFPCVASGYIVSRYQLYFRLFDRLLKKPFSNKVVSIVVFLLLMIVPFMLLYYFPKIDLFSLSIKMDFLYTSIFIYGLVNMIKIISNEHLFYPMKLLGEYSLPMWFIHCIFFNSCKEYTQILLFYPREPFLVLLWGLLICLSVSALIMLPIKHLLKIKNKLFFERD